MKEAVKEVNNETDRMQDELFDELWLVLYSDRYSQVTSVDKTSTMLGLLCSHVADFSIMSRDDTVRLATELGNSIVGYVSKKSAVKH